MNSFRLVTFLVLFVTPLATILAQDFGRQGGAPCSNGNCYNGSVTPSAVGIDTIVTSTLFDQMLKYRNDPRCKGNGYYTYTAFINAARKYIGFGTTGSSDDQRRELAAFFAQTSHETTGGWASAPDGQFAWGYCFVREAHPTSRYCDSKEWPCPQSYIGRGPIQLSHNYNYGLFGMSIGRDLINNPDLLATDPTLSFQSAIWFWMTPQGNKPSSHDVITGSAADRSAGRVSGYGVITNIINGGLECGHGRNENVEDRIGFYKKYTSILGVSHGNNLDGKILIVTIKVLLDKIKSSTFGHLTYNKSMIVIVVSVLNLVK